MSRSPWFAARMGALSLLFALGCGSSPTTSSTSSGGEGGSGGAPSSSSSGSTTTTSSTSTSGSTTTSSSGTGGSATTSSSSGTGGDATTSSSSGTGGASSSSSGSTSSSSGTAACTSDAQCDDGLFCNGAETCVAGACTAGTPPSCDDNVGCTNDGCDETAKACAHTPDASKCQDGTFCNGAEVCDATMGCIAGPPQDCDDGLSCTIDACDEAAKTCTHTPDDTKCVDALFCNGVETCDPANGAPGTGCKVGTPPSCDDNVMCTQDFCDTTSDACQHVPLDTACSDGLFCDGVEVCDPVNGAIMTGCMAGAAPNCDDGVSCTVDACDEAQKSCSHTPNHAACDDAVFCNGAETCDPANGAPGTGCKAGAAPNCSDGLDCTVDACNEGLKQCTHTPNNAACDDGLYCNGVETCSAAGPSPSGCVAGTTPACPPDNVACTVDACDEASKSCKRTTDNTLCPPGQFCVIQQGGCTTGTPCSTSAQCQDGDLCNGVEACVNGICKPGTPIDCDDGIACTTDSCNPANGQCSHATNDAVCNDGLACNGVETCDPANSTSFTGCVAGTPVNCNDNIACTQDICIEPNGTCLHNPIDQLCSDGQLCNGIETCDPTSGCKAGAPYVCPDDGIACTTQVCDPTINACRVIPDNSKCPCGQTCDAQQGCGNFCQVKTCQGKVYACGDCMDNDGDCKIDSADDQCLGPCDNTEDSFYGGIPGQAGPKCSVDCYFDQDSGAGNDNCYWDHRCDPLEVSASGYHPEGSQCAYNPNFKLTSSMTCSDGLTMQSQACLNFCGPLVPNGCDCFGCCQIPVPSTNTTVTVWLGSELNGNGSCDLAHLTDPTRCQPCTQVQGACLNTCEHCELCVGKTELPPDCQAQQCPGGLTPCGLPGQAPCGAGFFCSTGCCVPVPQ